MSELADYYPQLLVAAALLLAALAVGPLAHRVGLPEPAAFLAVGIVAGVAGVQPVGDLSPLALQQIGTLALYAVLFQGGLSTGWAAWRRQARPIVALGLPGTAVTAGGIALAGAAVGLPWEAALLVGVALAPTDPAAVYATLRGRGPSPARTVLEGESGFNDPVGIALMAVAVAAYGSEGGGVGSAFERLSLELGIGLAGGLVAALAIHAVLRVTPHLDDALQALAVVAVAVAAAALTATLHGSGFLAIYVAGLLVADAWSRQDGRRHAVPEALAATAEPVLFGLLGAAAAPLVGLDDIWVGVAVTLATVALVRPLVVLACTAGTPLDRPQRMLVWCGGLKGAVPLLLGALPALEALDSADRVQGVVLVATATSILVQGWTLRAVARRQAEAVSPQPDPAA